MSDAEALEMLDVCISDVRLQLTPNEFRIPHHIFPYLAVSTEIFVACMLFYGSRHLHGLIVDTAAGAAMLCYLAGSIFMTALGGIRGLYQPTRLERLKSSVLASALTATLAACLVYGLLVRFGAGEHAVRWTALWLPMALAGNIVSRCCLAWFVTRFRPNLSRRIAIVGSGLCARSITDRVSAVNSGFIELVGIFENDAARVSGATGRTLSDLVAYSNRKNVDVIVIGSNDPVEIQAICQRLRMIAADVHLATQALEHAASFRVPPYAGSLLLKQPLDDRQRLQKRCFDIGMSAALLLMMAPLLVLIAFAIACESRGPALFRQPRIGFNNRVFTVLKFRTMRHDMTDLLANRQTSQNDPRVTIVGRHLRRWSLDELPQLINVLRGDMSLVGPRPHAPLTRAAGRRLEEVVWNYADRHLVKPGLTGWAQVNGSRGEIRTTEDIEDRVRLDFDYIARWSLLFDLRIMVLTFRSVMGSGAY